MSSLNLNTIDFLLFENVDWIVNKFPIGLKTSGNGESVKSPVRVF